VPSNLAFGLATPVELLEKARREVARISSPPFAIRAGHDARYDALDAAINAAITLWHVTDWVAVSPQPQAAALLHSARKPGDNRGSYAVLKEFVISDKDLALCHDLCNGSKHLELDRPVTAPAHIDLFTGNTRELEALVSVRSNSPARWVPKIVTPQDGARQVAADVYKRAIAFWEKLFRAHGLIA
jgi:hypothetical protein